jgi:ubiquinone/menaquinone biosynthesis C-methylase UbiE
MKIDDSWNRYYGQEDSPGYKRYAYAVSHLFGSVLDVGCGDGFGIMLMNKENAIKKITGIDAQIEAIQIAKMNLKGIDATVLKAEAENIPFNGNSFDCVHCGQTLEHVKDDRQALKEIRRVVRNRVVFSVPINGGLSEEHVREYKTQKQFINLIGQYFNVTSKRIFRDGRCNRLVLITEK